MSENHIDRGVRVANALLAFVGEHETIRCLRDNIVVEPLDIDHGTMMTLVYRGQPVRGRVVCVGPGHFHRKYDGPKGKRSKSWDSKQFTATDIRPGDLVDLGGLELGGYLFTRVIWGSTDVVTAREADIAIVTDEATGESRPLHDRLLVRRLEPERVSASGIHLPSTEPEKTFQGEVVAVGRGRLLENGDIMPIDVKVGDRVYFNLGTHVVVNGELLIVMREEDVLAVEDEK